MKVKLLPVNEEEVIRKLYVACRTCYSAGSPITNYEKEFTEEAHSKEDMLKLIKYVMSSGHHSVLEHVQLTFLIEGISRSDSHQWVRHRLASISQQSQRYVEFKDGKFDFVIPKSIDVTDSLRSEFETTMLFLGNMYKKFIEAGVPAEDARAILPNACCTNMTWSCNLRELIWIMGERRCACAQEPIRNLAAAIAKEVGEVLPFMKPYLGPKCEMLGYCNEPKRTCGRKKLKEDVLGGYAKDEDTLTPELIEAMKNPKFNEKLAELMKMESVIE